MGRSKEIFIIGSGIISPAGDNVLENWVSLCGKGKTNFSQRHGSLVAEVNPSIETQMQELRQDKYLQFIDRTVLLAILAERQATSGLPRSDLDKALVFMGSSRGFVSYLESGLKYFEKENKVQRYSGAVSHLACLSAAVSRDLSNRGLTLSISSACSASLHCIGTASMLIQQGLATHAVVGGADSALTAFTLAQIKDLGVLTNEKDKKYPCRPMDPNRTGAVFGEGAAALVLSTRPMESPLARVCGYGASVENGLQPGVSPDGKAMQEAIRDALAQANLKPENISVIFGHATGTTVGDGAEWSGYQAIFGKNIPPVIFNKWCLSHLMGASGAASVVLACEHLKTGYIPAHPYMSPETSLGKDKTIVPEYVLVVAVGYGGNVAALILGKV